MLCPLSPWWSHGPGSWVWAEPGLPLCTSWQPFQAECSCHSAVSEHCLVLKEDALWCPHLGPREHLSKKTHCAAFINLIFFYTCTFIHLFDIILVLHESPSLDSILHLLSQPSQLWPPSPQLHYLPSHKLTQWNYHGDLKALLTQPSSTHPSSSSFLSLRGLLGERSTKHCKVTQEKEEKKHRARETEANEHVATWQWTESKSEGRWRFAGDLRGWGEERGVHWSLEKGDGCVWSQTGGSESFLLLLLL